MTGFKSYLSTSIILVCTMFSTGAYADDEAEIQAEVVQPDKPLIPSIRTLIQLQLQGKLQPKTIQKSTVQGECFYVENKSVGFTQKCKVVTTKRDTYTNRQLHTQNRIINIDTPDQDKGKPRHSMNALEAEQYYLSDGTVVVEADDVKAKAGESGWTCFKNIVMNVCYRV